MIHAGRQMQPPCSPRPRSIHAPKLLRRRHLDARQPLVGGASGACLWHALNSEVSVGTTTMRIRSWTGLQWSAASARGCRVREPFQLAGSYRAGGSAAPDDKHPVHAAGCLAGASQFGTGIVAPLLQATSPARNRSRITRWGTLRCDSGHRCTGCASPRIAPTSVSSAPPARAVRLHLS